MKKIKLASALFCSVFLFSCNDDSAEKDIYSYEETIVDLIPRRTPIKMTETQKSLVNSCNEFSFNFFRSSKGPAGSRALSPLSASYILGMLNDGAEGSTADEIVNVLGFNHIDKATINEFYANLIENAPKVDPNVDLDISNGIFVSDKLAMYDKYAEDMLKYYKAEVQSVDFSSPSARQHINNWLSSQTDDKAGDVEGEIGHSALSCWFNVISFKATWTDQFDAKDTKQEEFKKQTGELVNLPMMHRKALCLYAETPHYSAVCLPYSSGAYSMYILLPSDSVNTEEVINTLNSTSWNDMRLQMTEGRGTLLDLSIPRFTSSYKTDLIDILESMGMRKAFREDAEFPFISSGKLSVSRMRQLSTINVDEQGTKTTTVSFAESFYTAPEYIPFHANRPFVYLIQEETSGTIFLMGTYMGD